MEVHFPSSRPPLDVIGGYVCVGCNRDVGEVREAPCPAFAGGPHYMVFRRFDTCPGCYTFPCSCWDHHLEGGEG